MKIRIRRADGYQEVYWVEKKVLWWWEREKCVGKVGLGEVKKRIMETGHWEERKPYPIVFEWDTKADRIDHGEY